jgi:hypothetical protein
VRDVTEKETEEHVTHYSHPGGKEDRERLSLHDCNMANNYYFLRMPDKESV